MLHSFIFAAVAFIVFGRPEDLGAEEAVSLWLKSSVVNGLRFFDLAMRPIQYPFRRCQSNTDSSIIQGVLRFGKETV
jgi:hypothetical protein